MLPGGSIPALGASRFLQGEVMRISKIVVCFLSMTFGSITGLPTSTLNLDQVRIFDTYGNISWNDEKARLDNLVLQLRNESSAVAHIIAYGGRRTCLGEAQARASRAKNYLVNERGVEFSRVIWRDGSYRENLEVEIYIFPRGVAEPSVTPTVLRSEVQVKGRCKQNRRDKS
jgi:hypothetical protein